MTDLPIYFIRHNFDARKEVIPQFREKRIVGIHFSNEFHEQKEQYRLVEKGHEKSFERAFDSLSKMGTEGALIVFEYDSSDYFFIASAPPNQTVQPFRFASPKGELIYKVIGYTDCCQYNYAEHPVLLALRPPYMTVCKPGEHFRNIVNHLYFKITLPRSVNLLHPKMLEQLCETFLRSEFVQPDIRMTYSIMKTGKTMPIVDIVGRTIDGKRLLVQVTHADANKAYAKAKSLVDLQFSMQNTISIMFSAEKNLAVPGLNHHFNVQNVFSQFNESGLPWHQSMLDDMLGKYDKPQ